MDIALYFFALRIEKQQSTSFGTNPQPVAGIFVNGPYSEINLKVLVFFIYRIDLNQLGIVAPPEPSLRILKKRMNVFKTVIEKVKFIERFIVTIQCPALGSTSPQILLFILVQFPKVNLIYTLNGIVTVVVNEFPFCSVIAINSAAKSGYPGIVAGIV
ncbi:hypothetical protein D3C73_933300 [compost metagenome]